MHLRVYYDTQPLPPVEPAALLSDEARFKSYVTERLPEKPVFADVADLPEFYALMQDPPRLQSELIAHLQTMWDRAVAAEWQRVTPRLQACVDAFQPIPLSGRTMLDVIQTVTGRDLRPAFRLEALWAFQRVRFIPTLHNGPYVVWFGNDEELRIGFPAHDPPTHTQSGVRFDQTVLVNRHKALADETRLAILWALRETGQLSTQEIIDRFDLDKSAASRHLRQLVATSLIEEHREEGAKKVYQLNPQAIDEIIRMLNRLR